MRCSQCENELPDAATFCPSCGRTTNTGTTPTFSYLPPGTPPWPLTPLPKVASAQEIQAQANIPLARAASASRKGGRTLLTGLVFLILLPLLFAAGTLGTLYLQGQFPIKPAPKVAVAVPVPTSAPNGPTPTPAAQDQSQLPTPNSYKTASNPDLNVSVQYPSDWIVDNPNKSTMSTSVHIHTQQTLVDIILGRLSDSASAQISSADQNNQEIVQGLGNQVKATSIQSEASPDTQPIIGGIKWARADAVYLDGNGTKVLHITSISVQHNKDYYNIIFLLPETYYNESESKYIQPLLSSLRFLS